jgi:hypothetical protein
MKARLFLIFWRILVWTALAAQAPPNPFELVHRLPRVSVGGAVVVRSTNPFDVAPHRAPGASQAPVEQAVVASNPFSLLPRGNTLAERTLFWVLFALFALTTLSVAGNRKVVGKAWRGFINDSSLTLAQREAFGFVGSTPYYLLYLHFLLQAGVYFFLVVRFFAPEQFNNGGFLFACLLLAAGIFLAKHVLLHLIRWLFPVKEAVSRYNFLMIVFNCILGLFLVPFNLLIAFSSDYRGFMVFWSLGLVAVFYLYRSFRASPIGIKFLVDDQFHFLLYLCTVEITPVLFLTKLALNQA